VQQLAVVLREPHDRRRLAGRHIRQRLQLAVLRLLEVRVDRPAVRAPLRVTELLVDPLDHLLRERAAELVRVHVRLGGRVSHEVRQEPLDHAMLADHLPRPLGAGLGEEGLLVLAALHEAVGLQALQHLPGGRPRDAEHLGNPRGDRLRRPRPGRAVLADREREEVDRLEVLVDAVARHSAGS
jgi:hypothetical protein